MSFIGIPSRREAAPSVGLDLTLCIDGDFFASVRIVLERHRGILLVMGGGGRLFGGRRGGGLVRPVFVAGAVPVQKRGVRKSVQSQLIIVEPEYRIT